MTRSLTPVAALVAALLALAVALGDSAVPPASGHTPGPPASLCPDSRNVVTRGDWQVIAKPEELERVTAHAVGGVDGRTVLATDGKVVMRSRDGGCTWKEVWSVETAALPGESAETPHVAQLVYPDPGSERAVMVVDGIGQSLGSRLFLSEKNGDEGTWAMAEGLPVVGHYRDVIGDADQMYVITGPRDEIAPADQVTGALYRGDGKTFAQVSTGRPIVSLAVAGGGKLFAVRSNHDVERSTDGGASWAPMPISMEEPVNPAEVIDRPQDLGKDKNPWRWVAYKRDPDSGVAVLALAASETSISKASRIAISYDEGKDWRDLPVQGLGPIGGMTFANSPGQLILASGSNESQWRGPGLIVYDLGYQQFRDVDDLELASLFEPRLYPLSVGSRGHPGLFGVQLRAHRHSVYETADVIARYIPPDPPPPQFVKERPCLDRLSEIEQEGVEGGGGRRATGPPELPRLSGKRHGSADHKRSPRPGETHWEPDPLDIRLEPDKPQRTQLKVMLGAQPNPLDLGFIIDNSDNMEPGIDGVLCSIHRLAVRLRDRGIDARFGISSYNDRIAKRYRRVIDMTPDPEKLLRTVKTFYTEVGFEEPMRTALFQAATGAGLSTMEQEDPNDPPTAPRSVPVVVDPGLNLTLRPHTERVFMVVANEPYEEFTDDEPTVTQVTDALKQKGIKAFGIQLVHPVIEGVTGDAGLNQPRPIILRQQLETFARGTNAVAPRGGTDCDGGGTPDIPEGGPLVCAIDTEGMRDSIGDTIVALLDSSRQIADTEVVPETTSGLAMDVEGAEGKGVNVKQPSELAGALVVSCTAKQAGRRYPISLAVMVGPRKVASVPGIVTCGKLPSLAPSKAEPRDAAPTEESPAPTKREPGSAPTPTGNDAPQPQTGGAPASQPQPQPQAAAAAAPQGPPPQPAPINSPSPSTSPGASPSGATASASSAATSSAVSPAPGVGAMEEQTAPGPQVAFVHDSRPTPGPDVAPERAMSARRPSRAGSRDLAMVARRPLRPDARGFDAAAARGGSRDRSLVPAPAAITLGLGVCGAAGWLALGLGRRRPPGVARIDARR